MRKFKLYIALSIVASLFGLIGFYLLLNSPYLGVFFEKRGDNWYVKSVDPNGPASAYALIAGKKVVSIGNWQPRAHDLSVTDDGLASPDVYKRRSEARDYLAKYLAPGSLASITVAGPGRTNRTETAEIVVSTTPLSRILTRYAAYCLVGGLFLIMSLVIIFKRPGDSRARSFFILSIMSMLIYSTYGAFETMETVHSTVWHLDKIIYNTNLISAPFSISAMIYFSFAFPVEKKLLRNKGVLSLFFIIPAVVSIINTMQTTIANDIFIVFCALTATASVIHTYLTLESPVDKARIKWIAWGVSIPMALFALSTLETYFTAQNTIGVFIPIFSGVLIPVSIGFSILKYRLMDIETLFDKTVIYAVTIVILGLIDIGAIVAMHELGTLNAKQAHIEIDILNAWFIIIAYVPIRNVVQNIFKRLSGRESYDATETAIALVKRLLFAENQAVAFSRTLDALNSTLHPKIGICITSGSYRELYEEGSKIGLEFGSIDMGSIRKPTPLMDIFHYTSLRPGLSGGVCAPITGSTGNHGYIILGDKKSARLYDAEDLKFIETLANHLAMCADALKSREEMERVQKKAEHDHDHISREMHDGIGSSLVNAILLTDIIGKDPASASDNIPTLKKTLTAGLADLRGLVNATRETDENTLMDLASQIKELCSSVDSKGGLRCRISTALENYDRRLPANTKYNLVRMVQESIANTLKHANAQTIEISMIEKDNKLSIQIRDNGTGFDYSAGNGRGNGIENIKKRCCEIGAAVEIDSSAGTGTSIVIKINLIAPKMREERATALN